MGKWLSNFGQWLRNWWYTRVQRDLATVMASLAIVDLTPYSDDLKEIFPWPHWHAALRLGAAVGIWWRASQHTRGVNDNSSGPNTPT